MHTRLLELFAEQHVIVQALIATLFTWLVTAAGAAGVFLTRRFNQKFMDGMLGFSAGVMIAASFWSLLAPAIAMSDGDWLPAAVGFLAGGFCLYVVDKTIEIDRANQELLRGLIDAARARVAAG